MPSFNNSNGNKIDFQIMVFNVTTSTFTDGKFLEMLLQDTVLLYQILGD